MTKLCASVLLVCSGVSLIELNLDIYTVDCTLLAFVDMQRGACTWPILGLSVCNHTTGLNDIILIFYSNV